MGVKTVGVPAETKTVKAVALNARFVDEFLVDLNATQACLRMGYAKASAYVRGSEYLRRNNAAILAKIEEQAGITQARILHQLSVIAFNNIGRVLSFDTDGVVYKDSTELSPDDMSMIESVQYVTTAQGKSLKLKLYNRMDALEKLARIFKMMGVDFGAMVALGGGIATNGQRTTVERIERVIIEG